MVIVFHFPPMSGGGIIVAVDIVNSLAKLGHKVTVLTPDIEWKGASYQPKIDPRIKIIRVETPSRSKIKIAARRCKNNLRKKAEEIGKQKKFDFILTIFHPFHLAPNAAVESSKKLGIPVLIKIDDAIYEKSKGLKSVQRRVEKFLSSKVLNEASRIFVANEDTKKIIANFYKVPNKKISIIPNGIDLGFFDRKKHKNSKKIIFSGAMYHHRGLDILLKAAPKIIKKVPDVKFILLGDGPDKEKLQKIVQKEKLEANIEFKGWIDRDQIPGYLASSLVGIGPLKLTNVTKGALPIKVLEYMASSLPIIAKKGTLQNDVLLDGKNGFFVNDAVDLSDKIIFLLKNQNLTKKLGSESLKMAQKFSWKNVINSMLKIYKTI